MTDVTDGGNAPFIFFDLALFDISSFNSDIIKVTLHAERLLRKGDAVVSDDVAVAHLRCSRSTAIQLRNVLDKALEPPRTYDGPHNRYPLSLSANGGAPAIEAVSGLLPNSSAQRSTGQHKASP